MQQQPILLWWMLKLHPDNLSNLCWFVQKDRAKALQNPGRRLDWKTLWLPSQPECIVGCLLSPPCWLQEIAPAILYNQQPQSLLTMAWSCTWKPNHIVIKCWTYAKHWLDWMPKHVHSLPVVCHSQDCILHFLKHTWIIWAIYFTAIGIAQGLYGDELEVN